MKITLLKGLAILQIALALLGCLLSPGEWTYFSLVIGAALAMYLITNEAVDDERVQQLKLKGIKLGLVVGIFAMLLTSLFAGRAHRLAAIRPLSGSELLIVVMLTAILAVYYWQWRDGRVPLEFKSK